MVSIFAVIAAFQILHVLCHQHCIYEFAPQQNLLFLWQGENCFCAVASIADCDWQLFRAFLTFLL